MDQNTNTSTLPETSWVSTSFAVMFSLVIVAGSSIVMRSVDHMLASHSWRALIL